MCSVCVYKCVLEDVSWTECVFARSNHDDDDDDGDGDTPPRESYRNTHSQNVLNTTGTIYMERNIQFASTHMHTHADDAMQHILYTHNMTMTMEKLLANEFSPESGNYNFTRN